MNGVVRSATAAAGALFAMAERLDREAVFPDDAIATLTDHGLLLAPFPKALGGADLLQPSAASDLFEVLRRVGSGDLSTGRLYEGHVNAVGLVARYGTPGQLAGLADYAADGGLSAVWNAEGARGANLEPGTEGWTLQGGKILSSGAGSIARPLVTASREGGVWMTLPRLAPGERADLSGWTAQGMRSSATGTIDLAGIPIGPDDLVGGADDYKRQPFFSGGAWRFCAVQLGAIERLVDLFREALSRSGRGGDAYQRQRVADCVIAAGGAAAWIETAANLCARERSVPEAIVANVGFVRTVTERAGLDVMERVHRGVGLGSFVRPNAIERVGRDLATYLRQPAPDGAMADAAAFALGSDLPVRDLWRGG